MNPMGHRFQLPPFLRQRTSWRAQLVRRASSFVCLKDASVKVSSWAVWSGATGREVTAELTGVRVQALRQRSGRCRARGRTPPWRYGVAPAVLSCGAGESVQPRRSGCVRRRRRRNRPSEAYRSCPPALWLSPSSGDSPHACNTPAPKPAQCWQGQPGRQSSPTESCSGL